MLHPAETPSHRRFLLQGFVVGVTNPKTVVFLVAILPLFVSRADGSLSGQILVLGAVFSAIALVCDNAWGLFAGTVRLWFAKSPRRVELIGGIGGLAIIPVRVRLALTGRKDCGEPRAEPYCGLSSRSISRRQADRARAASTVSG